ncbi:hypothetical protein H2199_005617 [Coniosporium tulheliwenetii]|uniref:Uncharacterized protein n=1 Tax=Coniosporium tulheliwenetii TaxID=3383036 RepID=A0ACC2Z0R5_9PEZI|nr:hypothetical protein H2199_005617 [Cladosporium sp. JES 115]
MQALALLEKKEEEKEAEKARPEAEKQARKDARKAAKRKAAEEAGEESRDDSEPESEDESEEVVEEVTVHLPPYELTTEEVETYNKLFPLPTPPPAEVLAELAEAISNLPALPSCESTPEQIETYNRAYNKLFPLPTPPPAKVLAERISSLPALPVVEEEAANSAGASPDTAKAAKSKPKGAGSQVPKKTDSSGNGTDDESEEDSDDNKPPGGSKVRKQKSTKSPPKAAGSPPAPPRSDRSTSTTNADDLYKMPSPRPSRQKAPAASKEASTAVWRFTVAEQEEFQEPPKADASRAPPGCKPTDKDATKSDDESGDSSNNARPSGGASAGKRKRDVSKSDATESRPTKKTKTTDTKTNDGTKGSKKKSNKTSNTTSKRKDDRFDEIDPSLTQLTEEEEPLTTDWSAAVAGNRILDDGTDQLQKLKVVYIAKKTQKKVRAVYENGTPKDWSDQAVITLINRWRGQRHRRGPQETNRPPRGPWSDEEVALLRRIYTENPGITPSAAHAIFDAESDGPERTQDAIATKWSNLKKKNAANNASSTVTQGSPSNKSGLKLKIRFFKTAAEEQEEAEAEEEEEGEDEEGKEDGEENEVEENEDEEGEEEPTANNETEVDTEAEDDGESEGGTEIETEEASATESESTSGSGKRKRGDTPGDTPSSKRRK